MGKFYITTPIYYVNDMPHIGHAYTTIAADIFARYRRMRGTEVFFLTGTDEHGAKVARAARKKGLAPEIFCAQVAEDFKKKWDATNISYDRFIRTTEKEHEDVVQNVLQKLYDSGFLYKGEYSGFYCTGCEAIKLPADLVDGQCPDHLSRPEKVKEENWFFRLSSFQETLQEIIEKDEFLIRPEARKNEVVGLLKKGLEDVSFSRPNQPWGISLPFDPEQTTYVWIDALVNYLSAVHYGEKDDPIFKKFWPPDVQLMAKDILKFHGIIWPALLLALELPLPKLVFAHGYFTIAGQKMSKTVGNVVDPVAVSKKYGVDALRYFLFREFAFGEDGDYSEEKLADRYQYDLANDLGNLLHRVVTLAAKNFDGGVPNLPEERVSTIETAIVYDAWRKIEERYETIDLQGVLGAIWELVQYANRRINEKKPWAMKVERVVSRGDKRIYFGELPEIMYEMLEILRNLAYMVYPFMPETAGKILYQLGMKKESKISETTLEYERIKQWGGLEQGTKLKLGEPLFPKVQSLV